ncbi:MAG TPA: Na+/H+ antiporter NhaA [Rhodothermales bacterium]|nr:Na+/H+ antiporter NhaA [Rhodothermales bacterium]HRR09603.1 Na+/H+ antiporter NhaA [Rhodothermales bacterium]
MVKRLIHPFIHPIKEWSEDGKLSGILLVLATVVSITLTNSAFGAVYQQFWQIQVGAGMLEKSLGHWINDGLMVLFFFLVGLEIKRELLQGELSDTQKALLPAMAAVGGLVIPALIFTGFNWGSPYMAGWAIPTATDIAFSLGVLSLLGKRVPLALKVFLTALAIIDDLAAILIIAVFYSSGIQFGMLALAVLVMGVLFLLNKGGVKQMTPYAILGIILWFLILKSGIHATIAGVLLALTIPLAKVEDLEHALHKPVYYGILPVFALANTAILIPFDELGMVFSSLSYGIVFGLMIGKPVGILGMTYLSVKLGLTKQPQNASWYQIAGLGFTAGIGFTMSLFIASLSFSEGAMLNVAKLAILIGSVLSALFGLLILSLAANPSSDDDEIDTFVH